VLLKDLRIRGVRGSPWPIGIRPALDIDAIWPAPFSSMHLHFGRSPTIVTPERESPIDFRRFERIHLAAAGDPIGGTARRWLALARPECAPSPFHSPAQRKRPGGRMIIGPFRRPAKQGWNRKSMSSLREYATKPTSRAGTWKGLGVRQAGSEQIWPGGLLGALKFWEFLFLCRAPPSAGTASS